MNTILVTGFDPFGGETCNPSWEAVCRVPETIGGATVIRRQLPTVFGAAGEALRDAIREVQPDLVLCTGQAGGRAAITVERVAVNLRDARIPDNAGAQPADVPIRPDGPDGYLSTLPTRAMVDAIVAGGLPAALSYTAGTFVCNEVLYTLLDTAARENLPIRGGFIHVPYLPSQTVAKPTQPSMALEDIVRALTLALEAAI